jgi:hypothetical protein
MKEEEVRIRKEGMECLLRKHPRIFMDGMRKDT